MLEERSSQNYMDSLVSKANSLYSSAKSSHPIIQTSLDTIEPLVFPLVYFISAYRQNLVTSSSSLMQYEKGTFTEKLEFYRAAIQSWIHDHHEFEEFLSKFKEVYEHTWNERLTGYAQAFYSRSLLYEKPKEMVYLLADVLSEGYGSLQNAMVSAWENLKGCSSTEYLDRLKQSLGENWQDKFKDQAMIFFSVNNIKELLVASRGWAEDWVVKARETAERTTVILFKGADWGLTQIDNQILSRYTSIPPNIQAKGRERLFDMQSRLYSELSSFISKKKGAVQDLRLYQFLDQKLEFERGFGQTTPVLLELKDKIFEVNGNVRELIGKVVVYVRENRIIISLRKRLWDPLDYNGNGKVDIEDIIAVFVDVANPSNCRANLEKFWGKLFNSIKDEEFD